MLENLIKYADGHTLIKLYCITRDQFFKNKAQEYFGNPIFRFDDRHIVLSNIVVSIHRGLICCVDNYDNYLKLKVFENKLYVTYVRCKSIFHFVEMKHLLCNMFEELILDIVYVENKKKVLIELPEININLSDACVYDQKKINYITWNNS